MVSFTHEQNFICSQIQLDKIVHVRVDHYFYAVIFRSCCVLLAIEKEEQFALNIIINFIASLLGHSVNVLFQEEYNVQSY